MELETLPEKGGTAAIEDAPLAVQRLRIVTESRQRDTAMGGNGEATGELRRELAGPTILGTATSIAVESLRLVDDSVFERSYTGKTLPKRKISPTVQPEAEAFLSDEVRELLRSLMSISVTKAKRAAIRIDSIDISPFRHPEEQWTEIVMNISVVGNASQALAFWDSIGRAIDQWKQSLPKRLCERLEDRLSIDVFWS